MLLSCLGLTALPSSFVASAPRQVVVTTFADASITTDAVEHTLREAYKRLGMRMLVQRVPGERALLMANGGDADGDLCRVEGLERLYPNLLRVPVVVFTAELVVSTAGKRFPVESWHSLVPYSIGYTRGLKVVEINAPAGATMEPAQTLEQALRKMIAGRSDLVIDERYNIVAAIHGSSLRQVTVLEPPLATLKLYHYLNKRNAALIEPLTATLQQMEAEGTVRAIRERVVRAWSTRSKHATRTP